MERDKTEDAQRTAKRIYRYELVSVRGHRNDLQRSITSALEAPQSIDATPEATAEYMAALRSELDSLEQFLTATRQSL